VYVSLLQDKGDKMINKQLLGFFNDVYLANAYQKLADLYQTNPSIADSEERVILEYRKAYDSLNSITQSRERPLKG
jgi:hypothetical protein